jgi:ADP-ribose pyrophosphatase YjhB (NUDIX family)
MNFCSQCGAKVEQRIPAGDDRPRHVCTACEHIHYENPRMVVGCIIEQDGKLMMCKRAIEPRHGYWTVPAGFLELGESAPQGAVRETREEALARVEVIAPYAHFDVPRIGQAYLLYRARMLEPDYGPGPESLEVRFMAPDELPWDDLAFPVVKAALELYLEDMREGRFRAHHAVLARGASWHDFTIDDHIALRVG